ncbi:hypothetical protein SAMN05421780_111113 [Flexibacter flexilis DSM 6793]|uniref:Sulphur transport domain-containing protein n=1 Tax=Flexibacter flexilis DSM 6793 TaxID=927664 RepID=A0A1I1MV63_9BACT|nr:YeeE/YedE thiosulfate transporter family protein [Flexibacter flexilis]SFC89055.1 hypothetical protein SAMN05421780_111113 [Flexibacter flexilis DSM 6793]
MIDWLRSPWPWYVAGPAIGLTVPALLLLGNKTFGISSSLRHLCAACVPAKISFFQYDWRKERWNLSFVLGITLGAFIASWLLVSPDYQMGIAPDLREELASYGLSQNPDVLAQQLFGLSNLLTIRGLLMMVGGGFLVGFGTRYAGGCTSGHSISGIANLQWPSLVATICFMLGGIIVANFVLPFILQL